MNLFVINQTIQEMCLEVANIPQTKMNWRRLSEELILYEAAVCIFSSQMIFEVAEAAAKRILDFGLLRRRYLTGDFPDYKMLLLDAWSEPLMVANRAGFVREVRPRFRNRLASLLGDTINYIHRRGSSLRKILATALTPCHAREMLVKTVWGFGPKQASLFLRRIGFCSDLAVLDTHILDYLRLAKGFAPKPSTLARLPSYEEIEKEFSCIASEFGYSIGCVDLATWITMRVAKRETSLWA